MLSATNGITPAGAGKTNMRRESCAEQEDHPRRCGENPERSQIIQPCQGSPPQVRGKLKARLLAIAFERITPAGAGKTRFQQRLFAELQDHPRRCGENTKTKSQAFLSIGSPPQVRGKQMRGLEYAVKIRITPAGAGKTPTRTDMTAQREDHPRRCGENFFVLILLVILAGSPPQVRGKQSTQR